LSNNLYTYEGKTYTSLFQGHKAFYPGATFSNQSTVKSAYFLKAGETPGKLSGRKLETAASFISYSPKKTTPEGSVAAGGGGAASVAESEHSEPEDDEEHTCEDCGETYYGGDHICEEEAAPAPAPTVIIKGKAKVKKAAKA